MDTDKKIIFLHSYSPRTGHNYASEVIKVISRHEVLAHHRSETKLSTLLNHYFQVKKQIQHKSDEDFLDYLFLDDLREKILNKSDKEFVMIKDTSFLGVEKLPALFPDDIHILLIRDPKNVFSSLFKGMNLTTNNFRNRLKRAGKMNGMYPYYYSRKVGKRVLEEMPDMNNFFILRYEDLVLKEEKTLNALAKLFGTTKDLQLIKKEIDEIPVINSSFHEEVGGKKIWEAKPKTASFDPINRKGNSFLIRKGIEYGSKTLRKRLGYI